MNTIKKTAAFVSRCGAPSSRAPHYSGAEHNVAYHHVVQRILAPDVSISGRCRFHSTNGVHWPACMSPASSPHFGASPS